MINNVLKRDRKHTHKHTHTNPHKNISKLSLPSQGRRYRDSIHISSGSLYWSSVPLLQVREEIFFIVGNGWIDWTFQQLNQFNQKFLHFFPPSPSHDPFILSYFSLLLLHSTDFNSYGPVTIAHTDAHRVNGRMTAPTKPGLGVEPLYDILGKPVLTIG